MDQLKVALSEIPRIAGESLAVVYDAINAGHLKTFLVGRRRFARPDAIRAWVDYLESQSNAGKPVTYRARTLSQRRSEVGAPSGKLSKDTAKSEQGELNGARS